MSGNLERVPQTGLPALRGDHEEIRQVNAGLSIRIRSSGDLGIESGLGYLAQMASQAGELVEVGRERPVEVGSITLGDLIFGEVLTGAVLTLLAP